MTATAFMWGAFLILFCGTVSLGFGKVVDWLEQWQEENNHG